MSDFDTGIPDIPAAAPVPPWAVMGVQLLEALLQRLKTGDDPRDPQVPPDRPPAAPPDPARLQRSVRLLTHRIDRLAGALGACRCWGRNPSCRWCAGRGRPGSLEIDPAAFEELVLPLFQARPELFFQHVSPAVEVVPAQP